MPFKSLIDQVNDLTTIPPFDKEATVNYFKNFSDGFTDEHYEQWAKGKGKQLGPKTPLNPEFAKTDLARQNYFDPEHEGTYKDQILNDEEYLKESWNDLYEDILEYKYKDVDDDYTRSFGPVNTPEKYNSYLEWKKQGN